MRKMTAFAALLVLGMSTASIAFAQSGTSRDQRDTVSPDQAHNIIETLHIFLGGRGSIGHGRAWWVEEKDREKSAYRQRQDLVPGQFRDDPAASSGGD